MEIVDDMDTWSMLPVEMWAEITCHADPGVRICLASVSKILNQAVKMSRQWTVKEEGGYILRLLSLGVNRPTVEDGKITIYTLNPITTVYAVLHKLEAYKHNLLYHRNADPLYELYQVTTDNILRGRCKVVESEFDSMGYPRDKYGLVDDKHPQNHNYESHDIMNWLSVAEYPEFVAPPYQQLCKLWNEFTIGNDNLHNIVEIVCNASSVNEEQAEAGTHDKLSIARCSKLVEDYATAHLQSYPIMMDDDDDEDLISKIEPNIRIYNIALADDEDDRWIPCDITDHTSTYDEKSKLDHDRLVQVLNKLNPIRTTIKIKQYPDPIIKRPSRSKLIIIDIELIPLLKSDTNYRMCFPKSRKEALDPSTPPIKVLSAESALDLILHIPTSLKIIIIVIQDIAGTTTAEVADMYDKEKGTDLNRWMANEDDSSRDWDSEFRHSRFYDVACSYFEWICPRHKRAISALPHFGSLDVIEINGLICPIHKIMFETTGVMKRREAMRRRVEEIEDMEIREMEKRLDESWDRGDRWDKYL
jgi:hypothetical protein